MSEVRPIILVADDDPDLRRLVRLHLETASYEILEANDGAQALETILVEHPALVVLDVMMPELTGWEILRYLRGKPEYADIGVLMLTGIGESLNELSSPIYGADDHLDKPFKGEDLLSKVSEILAKRGGCCEEKC
ncbi:MAG: response regulator [Proteobacteria bacterium]|nr:response regulator [Pseudomonadota bacterium]